MERREQEQREAAWKAKEAANARRLEREYQRAISASGAVADNARWERLYDETLDKYGGRYDLCQWEDEGRQAVRGGTTQTARDRDNADPPTTRFGRSKGTDDRARARPRDSASRDESRGVRRSYC